MSTIRSYFYRSMRLAFKVCLLILACLLVFILLGWILPSSIANGFLIATSEKLKIFFVFLVLSIFPFLIFEMYWALKRKKLSGKEFLKMIPTIAIWPLVLFLSATHIEKLFNHIDCKNYNYNNQLNGGSKEFNGKRYELNICGSGVNNSHFFGSTYDTVTLFITDEQGQLLAKRDFKVFWEGQPGHVPLKIGKESIIYQDDESQTEHAVTMPPGSLEWIRARIPMIN